MAVDGVRPSVESVSAAGPGPGPSGGAPYGLGSVVNITVAFSEAVNVAGTPRLLLDVGASHPAGQPTANYSSGSGTASLSFLYAVREGDEAAPLEYAGGQGALSLGGGAGGSIKDAAGNAAGLELPGAARALRQLGGSGNVAVDGVRPSVESVSSPNADGVYGADSRIGIEVAFSEAVNVTGTPHIVLDTDPPRTADYGGPGTGPNTLAFAYTVQRGDSAPGGLEYRGAGALVLGGTASIRDEAGNDANTTLPDPGFGRSLGDSTSIVVEAPALGGAVTARVASVFSPGGNATYGIGSTVRIAVAFSADVSVSGAPTLALGIGSSSSNGNEGASRAAAYESGGGTDELVFAYAVREGDEADGLDYADAAALQLNGGAITTAGAGAGIPASLVLPDAGSPGSLAGAGRIVVDGVRPSVDSVSSPNADGAYGPNSRIGIEVAFSEEVAVAGGTPHIVLDTDPPRTADYDGPGTGPNTLAFAYTVQRGDSASGGLEYRGAGALVLNGSSSIRDAAGNDAALVLPEPGTPHSLGGSGSIVVDGVRPSVVSVFSPDADGEYGAGSTIRIAVALDEPVYVSGTPLLALSTVPARSALYSDGTDGDAELEFRYTVLRGDTADPLGYAGAGALSLAGASIADAAGNPADLSLPEPGSPGSLRSLADIAVRTDIGGTGTGTGGVGAVTLVVGPGGLGGSGNVAGGGDGLRIVLDVGALVPASGNGTGNNGTGGRSGTATFPPDGAVVVSASFASITIPPGATASGVPTGGLLVMHAANSTLLPELLVQDRLAYAGSGAVAVQGIVEIGAVNSTIVFDMPVRIQLEGQAGGRAFYIDGAGGSIEPIDRACAADDVQRVHRQLGGAGECQLDGAGGGAKIVYTYHLTRFGTVLASTGAPAPTIHECTMRLGTPSLHVEARPGAVSTADTLDVANLGSLPFAGVALEATPWYIDPASGRPGPYVPSLLPSLPPPPPSRHHLPASLTMVGEDGAAGPFVALSGDGGTAVARGLGGGLNATLWFQLDLTAHANVEGGRLVQHVAYLAECVRPTQ